MFSRFRKGNRYPDQGPHRNKYQQVSKFSTNAKIPSQIQFMKQEVALPPLLQQPQFFKKPEEMKRTRAEAMEQTQIKQDEDGTKTSATTKALNQVEGEQEAKKPRLMRPAKISTQLKRQKMNERLAKILTPKNALLLLNEIKPGCSYITKESPGQGVGISGFTVQVKHEKDILGTGQGLSKSQAKSCAAENAIKTLFSKAVKSTLEGGQSQSENEQGTVFPWAGLVQFAMYKMLNEWQLQEPGLPSTDIQKFFNSSKLQTPKFQETPNPSQVKKELPPDAHNLHPTTVLNHIHPGLLSIELERTAGPPSRVKVAFELDGKQYCGISTNKKEAKKEAAKALLSSVYGVKYES